ncbi:hypothetical protein [Aliivibrio fischeri]|uniref:hypothetical protein n=1 Tax=Aliivibrio fischeri TaxID=668 RepID=UPI0012DAC93F|nr:hypothetical protein [Aliivibrio fischeri]MUJ25675.1 hypothetical protein [Aliivibrio fischeri]
MLNIKKSLCVLMLMSTSMMVNANDVVKNDIREEVQTWIDIEVAQKKSTIQKMVFSCDFYVASPKFKTPDGGTTGIGGYLFYKNGEQLDSLVQPSSNETMPALQSCIKPNFTVTDEDSAQLLMEAIESVFSQDQMFSDSFEKQVKRTTKGWELITGDFFEDLSGYIIKTDKAGKITQIRYSLNL